MNTLKDHNSQTLPAGFPGPYKSFLAVSKLERAPITATPTSSTQPLNTTGIFLFDSATSTIDQHRQILPYTMPRTTKKNQTKSKDAPSTDPPPQAPLLGLPPELRNTIYHLVAEEVDEVGIIARRIDSSLAARNHSESLTETNLWKAVAKHPLSQTCRHLRQEFDPTHRHRAFTTKVRRYYLDLDNYDLKRISPFSRALSRMPALLSHLSPRDVTIRYQINKYAPESIDALKEMCEFPRHIDDPFERFHALGVHVLQECGVQLPQHPRSLTSAEEGCDLSEFTELPL